MSAPLAHPEQASVERLAVLEEHLAKVTAERDQVIRERDQYKSRAEWLHTQLERLRYDAKT